MPRKHDSCYYYVTICHGIVQGHWGLEDIMLFWFVESVSGRSYFIEANVIFCYCKDIFSS